MARRLLMTWVPVGTTRHFGMPHGKPCNPWVARSSGRSSHPNYGHAPGTNESQNFRLLPIHRRLRELPICDRS